MTRKEFMDFVQKNGHEFYTIDQIHAFHNDLKKSVDPVEKEHGAIDFVSLERVEVRNDDLTKSVMFWRPAQVEWREEIDPDTLLKSRDGYYKDTPANRRKGIVGKKYGDEKADQYEEAPRAGHVAKLKQDYAIASKKGDKKAMAKIGAQIKALGIKEGESGKDKKD